MSISTTSTSSEQLSLQAATPSFFGAVWGELFKLSRQRTTWVLLILLTGIIFLPYLLRLTISDTKDSLNNAPLAFFSSNISSSLSLLRVFGGFVLIVLTARIIGLEYQLGTIRVLLSRGVGRLQLLGAKVVSAIIIALTILIGGVLLNVLLTGLLMIVTTGNMNALSHLTPQFWNNSGIYLLTVLISMGVTLLMATAVTILGRSLAFGLSFGLCWFAADNFGTAIMALAFALTRNTFWQNITAYFLGPNLNVMVSTLITNPPVSSLGFTPLLPVDSTHTLVVTLVYALIFIAAAATLAWQRDIKE